MYLVIYLRSCPRDGTLVYKAFSFLLLQVLHSFSAAGSGIRIYPVVSVQSFLTRRLCPPLICQLEKGNQFHRCELAISRDINVFQYAGLDTAMPHSMDSRSPFGLRGSSWQPWHSHYKASD